MRIIKLTIFASPLNKLRRVTDAVANTSAGRQGYNRVAGAPDVDYGYDSNGNLIYDPAREMTIYYNHLNLPDRFEFEDCRVMSVVYDAVGTKLATVMENGGRTVRKRVYTGGIEYLNGRFENIAHKKRSGHQKQPLPSPLSFPLITSSSAPNAPRRPAVPPPSAVAG